ncbi:MAG: hypothetical protein U1G07_19635 [Verrucomicrobiota bacterium]
MISQLVRSALCAGLLWASGRALAVSFDPLSIEALSQQAEIILQGTILSKTCLRDSAGRIYTRMELQVSDVWKGSISGSPFLLVHGGGILGDQEACVSGQVHYDPGEEVVAFLTRNQRGEGVTIGLAQGKFTIWKDRATGLKYAASVVHGVTEGRTGGAAPQNRAGQTRSAAGLELTRLKQQVVEAAR